jgi:hypothetical protein
MMIGINLGSAGEALLQKIPLFGHPELRIMTIQTFPFEKSASNTGNRKKEVIYILMAEPESKGIGLTDEEIAELEQKSALQELTDEDIRKYDDLARIKNNVNKMVKQNASEEEIDKYIELEGTTPEEIRNFKPNEEQPKKSKFRYIDEPSSMRKELPAIYVKTNRETRNVEEQHLLEDAVNKALVQDLFTKEVDIKDDYDKTVVYTGLNSFGDFLNGVWIFIIVVFSLALYFPLIKTIINLFRKKRIFLSE